MISWYLVCVPRFFLYWCWSTQPFLVRFVQTIKQLNARVPTEYNKFSFNCAITCGISVCLICVERSVCSFFFLLLKVDCGRILLVRMCAGETVFVCNSIALQLAPLHIQHSTLWCDELSIQFRDAFLLWHKTDSKHTNTRSIVALKECERMTHTRNSEPIKALNITFMFALSIIHYGRRTAAALP